MSREAKERTPLDVVKAVVAAAAAKDVEAYIANYHDNAVMRLRDGSVISGRDRIRERFVGVAASGLRREVELREELTVYGDEIALVCTGYMMRLDDGETVDQFRGSAHDVLTQDADGAWLISIDHPFEEWASQ
jgi:uncharacterized protein (TIGR02246 family)